MANYDVVVIGGGPGGYVAAIRAAQLGFKTACVERWLGTGDKPVLGGTCLNVGCIPSKALLDSSHHYAFLRHEAAEHGIVARELALDLARMQARKSQVVVNLTQGIAGLFKKHKVTWLKGSGAFRSPTEIEVTAADGRLDTIAATHVIVATGSVPANIPVAPVDQIDIVDSTGALAFDAVPRRLGVIGAGVIGLELGSVWRRLGSEVVVLEALPDFLPAADTAIAKEAFEILGKQGLDIRLGTKVTSASAREGEVSVRCEREGKSENMVFDKLVVAVGRKPNTVGLAPERAGLTLDARGFIAVDAHCHTGVGNIYAVGDCVRGPMLAHKASEEGVAVAERIAGQTPHLDFNLVPWVIYTWPEIAWVGHTEQALTAAGRHVRTGSFPFLASGRARAMGSTEGLVKIVCDAGTDSVLGVHILGPNASELIAEAVTAMEYGASSEDIARTVHAHPTLAEAMHEAALAVDRRALHF
jgi:dihydrolipoamide dehydrogenase